MPEHDAHDYAEHHFFAQGRMWVPETDLNEAQAEIRRLRTAGLQLAADTATESATKDADIERLQAEVERLTFEAMRWADEVALRLRELEAVCIDRDEQVNEVVRLRTALSEIAETCIAKVLDTKMQCACPGGKARRALAEPSAESLAEMPEVDNRGRARRGWTHSHMSGPPHFHPASDEAHEHPTGPKAN